jgi:hypothetical protein
MLAADEMTGNCHGFSPSGLLMGRILPSGGPECNATNSETVVHPMKYDYGRSTFSAYREGA